MILSCLGHVKFEPSVMHPKGGTEKSVIYRDLELRKESDMNL